MPYNCLGSQDIVTVKWRNLENDAPIIGLQESTPGWDRICTKNPSYHMEPIWVYVGPSIERYPPASKCNDGKPPLSRWFNCWTETYLDVLDTGFKSTNTLPPSHLALNYSITQDKSSFPHKGHSFWNILDTGDDGDGCFYSEGPHAKDQTWSDKSQTFHL